MKNSIIFLFFIALFSCGSVDSGSNTTLWVNSYKVSCQGVTTMKCLQIQKNREIDFDAWQNFSSDIEGFSFEPGYIYKIVVKEEKVINPPADASNIKYTLVKIEEKKLDERMKINDIWVLEKIGEKNIPAEKNVPQMEFNVSDMRFYGNDGCNNFSGKLDLLDKNQIIFGLSAGTKKACFKNAELTDEFNNSIKKVRRYEIKDLKLFLYNETGDNILTLKKVD